MPLATLLGLAAAVAAGPGSGERGRLPLPVRLSRDLHGYGPQSDAAVPIPTSEHLVSPICIRSWWRLHRRAVAAPLRDCPATVRTPMFAHPGLAPPAQSTDLTARATGG